MIYRLFQSEQLIFGLILLLVINHLFLFNLVSWSFTSFNREFQYALALALFGLGTCFTASSNTMVMFIIFNSLAGLATTGIDIASYVWILEIYKENANPYLQAMGGFWAIGQTLAPLITRPFLSSDQTIINGNETIVTKHTKTSIQIPYNIIGILTAGVGFLVLLFSCFYNNQHTNDNIDDNRPSISSSFSKSKEDHLKEYGSTSDRQKSSHSQSFTGDKRSIKQENSSLLPKSLPKGYYVAIVLLAALMMNFQVGLDLDFFNFLHTYAVQGPTKMDKSDASYLVSLTGFVQLASRFISIFISIYIKSGTIIATSTIVTLFGVIILVLSGSTVSGLWAGAIILSIGFAPVGSSIYTYIEERTTVTNTIAGILSFSSTILSTTGPYIVGASLDTHPFIFILYILICNISIIILFVLLLLTDLWKRRYLEKQKNQSAKRSTVSPLVTIFYS